MEYTKGKWIKEGNKIKAFGKGTIAICPSPTNNEGVLEFVGNTFLIASAVNACIKLNPDNPLAVAESISDLYEALKELSDFLYALGGDEKLIPPEVYHRIKVKYLRGYKALAKAEDMKWQ